MFSRLFDWWWLKARWSVLLVFALLGGMATYGTYWDYRAYMDPHRFERARYETYPCGYMRWCKSHFDGYARGLR